MLQSLILFSLFAASPLFELGEMAKANQMTWRHADGFHPHIVESLNKWRLGLNLPPLSHSLSSSLSLSRRTKLSSVEYSQCSGQSSGKQCLDVSSKDVNKESLWHAAQHRGLVVREMLITTMENKGKECDPSQECNHQFFGNFDKTHNCSASHLNQ